MEDKKKKISGVVNRNKYERYVKAACCALFLSRKLQGKYKPKRLANPREMYTQGIYNALYDYFVKYDNALSNNVGQENMQAAVSKLSMTGISPEDIINARKKGYKLEQDFYEYGEEWMSYVGSKYDSFKQSEKELLLVLLGKSKNSYIHEREAFSIMIYLMASFYLWKGSCVATSNPEPELNDLKQTAPVFQSEYDDELDAILDKCVKTNSTNEGENAGLKHEDLISYLRAKRLENNPNLTGIDSRLAQLRNELMIQYKDAKRGNITLSENYSTMDITRNDFNNMVFETVKRVLKNNEKRGLQESVKRAVDDCLLNEMHYRRETGEDEDAVLERMREREEEKRSEEAREKQLAMQNKPSEKQLYFLRSLMNRRESKFDTWRPFKSDLGTSDLSILTRKEASELIDVLMVPKGVRYFSDREFDCMYDTYLDVLYSIKKRINSEQTSPEANPAAEEATSEIQESISRAVDKALMEMKRKQAR